MSILLRFLLVSVMLAGFVTGAAPDVVPGAAPAALAQSGTTDGSAPDGRDPGAKSGPVSGLGDPLTFSTRFSPSTMGPGSTSRLVYDISNPLGVPITDIAFTNALPAAVTVAGTRLLENNCFNGVVTAEPGTSAITFSDGAIESGGSCRISLLVTATTLGVHNNTTGELTSSAGTSSSASADLTINADLPEFSKRFDPSSATFGQAVRAIYTLDNSLGATDYYSLSFSETFPLGVVIANPPQSSNTCGNLVFSGSPGTSTIFVRQGSNTGPILAAGISCQIEFDIVAGAAGVLETLSSPIELLSLPGPVTLPGAAGTLNVDSLPTEGPAVLMSFDPGIVSPGGSVDLNFTIINGSRDAAASEISFVDDLDAMLSGAAAVGLPFLTVKMRI